jgi:ATP-dependent helicase HepA
MPNMWKIGQLVWIELDHGLGVARVVDVSDAQFLQIEILKTQEKRNYVKKNPPLKRAQFYVGQKVKVKNNSDEICIEKVELIDGLYTVKSSKGSFGEDEIVEIVSSLSIVDLLRQKKITHSKLFHVRHEAWKLWMLRDAYFLKGAAGCRIQLLPHQIAVLSSALQQNPIRALLADEVGLGKTIEAGLIFSALHARQELKRVLVLVPPALKVQWLTECFRRFNVRFRLDHEELIDEDEFRDFVIASLDEIDQNTSAYDLLIVDEAHRLSHDVERSDKLSHLVKNSRHVLFLSATPWVYGKDEFSKMMQILSTQENKKIEALIYQSKRVELGLSSYRSLEAVYVEDKNKWLFDFISARIDSSNKEKVFFITSQLEEVKTLHETLRKKFGEKFSCFHEEMDLVERDRQAAYFADPEGALFLISSEIGGEGRNFQFCQDMVLLDLPPDPLVVEQRIGRLDRIGQTKKVRVWCPVLVASPEEEIFETLRDKYQVFERAWSGSGLEDLHGDQDILASIDETLDIKREKFNKEDLDKWMSSLVSFSETPIKDTLDKIYNVFGVEVEDFDTMGNWHIQASSLMFVDYFPGLDDFKERTLTFDREQALVREEMTFYSVDHPDFVESLEFFLASEQGKLSLCRLNKSLKPDIYLQGLFRSRKHKKLTLKIWSLSQGRELDVDLNDNGEAVHVEAIPEKFWEALESSLHKFIETESDSSLDSLKIFIP